MTNCTQSCTGSIATSRIGVIDTLVYLVRQWMHEQQLKASIKRERSALLSMSDAMLKDIGIDRVEAQQEAHRNDIPANR